MTKATVGRIVHYVSRNGDGITSPAVVLRTRESTNLDVIERWGYQANSDGTLSGKGRPADLVPELPDDETVDLLVHGLGGDYREYAVPYTQQHDDTCLRCSAVNARSWHWATECNTGELSCQNPEGDEAAEVDAGDDAAETDGQSDERLDGNLDEVAERIAGITELEELDGLSAAEESGKARKGVAEAIERRRAELSQPQTDPPTEAIGANQVAGADHTHDR